MVQKRYTQFCPEILRFVHLFFVLLFVCQTNKEMLHAVSFRAAVELLFCGFDWAVSMTRSRPGDELSIKTVETELQLTINLGEPSATS